MGNSDLWLVGYWVAGSRPLVSLLAGWGVSLFASFLDLEAPLLGARVISSLVSVAQIILVLSRDLGPLALWQSRLWGLGTLPSWSPERV